MVGDERNRFIFVFAKMSMECCVAFQRTNHSLRRFNNPADVFEAIIAGTGVNQVSHTHGLPHE